MLGLHSQGQKQLALLSPSVGGVAPNGSDFCFAKVLEILLTKLIATSKLARYESRSSNFYLQLCQILVILEQKDLEVLQTQVMFLIDQLPKDII